VTNPRVQLLREALKITLEECHETDKLSNEFTECYLVLLDMFLLRESMEKYPFEMKEEFKSKCLERLCLSWRKLDPKNNVAQCLWTMFINRWKNEIRDSQRDKYQRFKWRVEEINRNGKPS
jgi:hypothetical protein